jgi:hypothetical protein
MFEVLMKDRWKIPGAVLARPVVLLFQENGAIRG